MRPVDRPITWKKHSSVIYSNDGSNKKVLLFLVFFFLNTTKTLRGISDYGNFLCLFLDNLPLQQTDVSVAGFANRSRNGRLPRDVVAYPGISFAFTR